MASAFGVGDEVDEQHTAVGPIRRLLAELVAPQPDRPPGAQLMRCQTDDIGTLARPRDELEVVQPDLVEWKLIRRHATPTF